MKQDEYNNKTNNAGATKVQQLNTGRPEQRQSIESQPA